MSFFRKRSRPTWNILLRKADRMGITTSQMEIVTARVSLNVAVTVASLDTPGRNRRLGAAAHGIRGGD